MTPAAASGERAAAGVTTADGQRTGTDQRRARGSEEGQHEEPLRETTVLPPVRPPARV